MNIKLKATLITAAIPLIAVAFVYTIVKFPAVLFFAFLGGFLYFVYRGVLNYLEYKEKNKK
jgi:predicted Zn-dependent protease